MSDNLFENWPAHGREEGGFGQNWGGSWHEHHYDENGDYIGPEWPAEMVHHLHADPAQAPYNAGYHAAWHPAFVDLDDPMGEARSAWSNAGGPTKEIEDFSTFEDGWEDAVNGVPHMWLSPDAHRAYLEGDNDHLRKFDRKRRDDHANAVRNLRNRPDTGFDPDEHQDPFDPRLIGAALDAARYAGSVLTRTAVDKEDLVLPPDQPHNDWQPKYKNENDPTVRQWHPPFGETHVKYHIYRGGGGRNPIVWSANHHGTYQGLETIDSPTGGYGSITWPLYSNGYEPDQLGRFRTPEQAQAAAEKHFADTYGRHQKMDGLDVDRVMREHGDRPRAGTGLGDDEDYGHIFGMLRQAGWDYADIIRLAGDGMSWEDTMRHIDEALAAGEPSWYGHTARLAGFGDFDDPDWQSPEWVRYRRDHVDDFTGPKTYRIHNNGIPISEPMSQAEAESRLVFTPLTSTDLYTVEPVWNPDEHQDPFDPRIIGASLRRLAVHEDLLQRLHDEFHDWYAENGNERLNWAGRGPLGNWHQIENFLKDRYPEAHRGITTGKEEAGHLLDTGQLGPDGDYCPKCHGRGFHLLRTNEACPACGGTGQPAQPMAYATGQDAVDQFGYDPKEIAAGMLLLHNRTHEQRSDLEQGDNDRLSEIARMRSQMMRSGALDYADIIRLAGDGMSWEDTMAHIDKVLAEGEPRDDGAHPRHVRVDREYQPTEGTCAWCDADIAKTPHHTWADENGAWHCPQMSSEGPTDRFHEPEDPEYRGNLNGYGWHSEIYPPTH